MLCVDWGVLWRCSECMSENESECKEVCSNVVTGPHGGAFYVMVVSAYLLVLLAFLIYRAIVLAKDLKSCVNMQRFYTDDLGITDSQLQTIEWNVVTQRLISLQVSCIAVKGILSHPVLSPLLFDSLVFGFL